MENQESPSSNLSSKSEGDVSLQRAPQSEIAAFLEVEKMRTDMVNRQTEVARISLEAQNLADERQFTFASRRLEYQKDIEEKRILTGGRIVWGLIGVAALPFFLTLLMFFFGSDTSREGAKSLLIYGGTALAGWGAISAIKTAFSTVFSKQDDPD